ncbi:hypothetical protein, partial [Vibrio cholerae]|uniref:hypothetical protein n=1 Tax=Vibrio cholerae TaxID=666 RepID=UPI001F4370D0
SSRTQPQRAVSCGHAVCAQLLGQPVRTWQADISLLSNSLNPQSLVLLIAADSPPAETFRTIGSPAAVSRTST